MSEYRRCIVPGVDAEVWNASGRRGPKRVQVGRCLGVLRAEDGYTELLRDDATRAKPGARGSVEWTVQGRSGRRGRFTLNWELRANAVWRHGRLFFRCPECARLAARLYVPREDTRPACRRCWGLTYESRQERNYRAGGAFARVFASHREWSRFLTWGDRERRAAASAKRYAERREILGAAG